MGIYQLKRCQAKRSLKSIMRRSIFKQHKGVMSIYILKMKRYTLKIVQKYKINCNRLLDIGTGEGFFAHYFYDLKWHVRTVDYSDFGIKSQNPQLLSTLEQGDMFQIIDNMLCSDKQYSLINISNVLEHVVDPIKLLEDLKSLLDKNGMLRISVPNDYSNFQKYLLKQDYVTDTWFCPPDHLHYFSFESLSKLLNDLGYKVELMISDFPIEVFLVNQSSNYNKNRELGKNAHLARVEMDNFLFDEGIEKYINYFQASASINFGRQIIMYARKNIKEKYEDR